MDNKYTVGQKVSSWVITLYVLISFLKTFALLVKISQTIGLVGAGLLLLLSLALLIISFLSIYATLKNKRWIWFIGMGITGAFLLLTIYQNVNIYLRYHSLIMLHAALSRSMPATSPAIIVFGVSLFNWLNTSKKTKNT